MRTPVAGDVLRFIRRYSTKPASETAFETLAMRVFRFQFEKNALYRRFCEMEGMTPDNLTRWKDIPAMPASAFKELVLATFPVSKKRKIFKTSGTTQETRGAHYFETLDLYDASIPAPFEQHVLSGGRFSFYFLTYRASQAPNSSLSYMMEEVNRRFAGGKGRFYVRAGWLDNAALAKDLQKEKKKVVLLSTMTALVGFLGYVEEWGVKLKLPAGSRLMETGGPKGLAFAMPKKRLYALCAKSLGIAAKDCVSEYGMTELSSQYYSRNDGPFKGPAWLRAVVVDPATGKECARGRAGILKHVDLANTGSVMAVQTEDLGRAKANGFEFLGRAKGSEVRGCSLSYKRFLRSSS